MHRQDDLRDSKPWTGIFFAVAILGCMAISSPLHASDYDSRDDSSSADFFRNLTVTGDMIYATGTAGCSTTRLDAGDISTFDAGASTSGSRTDCLHLTGASAGLQFHPNIAAEIGYANIGKYKLSATGTEMGSPLSESATFKATGFQAALVGSVPVSKEIDILGRIGLIRWKFSSSNNGVESGVPFSSNESARGTGLTYGLGVRYNFSRNIGVSLEWQRFDRIGDQERTGRTDIDMLSLGLVYRFR